MKNKIHFIISGCAAALFISFALTACGEGDVEALPGELLEKANNEISGPGLVKGCIDREISGEKCDLIENWVVEQSIASNEESSSSEGGNPGPGQSSSSSVGGSGGNSSSSTGNSNNSSSSSSDSQGDSSSSSSETAGAADSSSSSVSNSNGCPTKASDVPGWDGSNCSSIGIQEGYDANKPECICQSGHTIYQNNSTNKLGCCPDWQADGSCSSLSNITKCSETSIQKQ